IGFAQSDLERVTTAMMAVVDRPRPRLAFVTAPLRRHLYAFVWLPRDMMSTAVRLQIQGLLENSTGADTLDWSLQIEGSTLAMLRYVLDLRGQDREPDFAAIDARFQEMLRGWPDAVEAAIADAGGASRAAALAARYAEAFPQAYRADYGPAEAAQDIERLRRLASGERDCPLGRDARLYRLDGDPLDQVRLKIYQLGGAMPLSDAVPAPEDFGLRVLADDPTRLGGADPGPIHHLPPAPAPENFGFGVLAENPTRRGGTDPGTIHDFRLALAQADPDAVLARAEAIEQAIGAVINARAEDDVFNRLIVGTGLSAQEAD